MADRFYSVPLGGSIAQNVTESGAASPAAYVDVRVTYDATGNNKLEFIRALGAMIQFAEAGFGGDGLAIPSHFVSQTASNGYALGVNSGPGTSKSAPWLTLDYAISNAPSGSVIEINDGTYQAATFYNVSAKTLTIQSRVRDAGVLRAAASQTRVINVNPSSATMLTLINLRFDGQSNTTRGITMSNGAPGITGAIAIRNCSIAGVTSGHFEAGAMDLAAISIEGLVCEGAISGRPIFAGIKDGTFNVSGATMSGVTTTGSGQSAVEVLRNTGGVSNLSVSIRGVNGTFIGPAALATNGIVVTNCDDAVIGGNSLTISGSSGSSGALYKIFSNSATLTAHRGVVSGNRGHVGHDIGYCVLIGSDATGAGNGRHNDPLVENNDITANPASAQPIHGYMLGWGSGGNVRRNKVSGAGHSLLAKDWVGGTFAFNEASVFSFEGIYAKGATGTTFANNTLTIGNPISEAAVRVALDDVSLTPSTGIILRENRININVNPPKIVEVATGSDAAFTANFYNINAVLGTVPPPWSYQGTGYTTFAAWKAAIEPTALP